VCPPPTSWHPTPPPQALQYKGRIKAALPPGSPFTPLMTLYLTDNTPPDEVAAAHAAGVVAFKLYPAGATTNSGAAGRRFGGSGQGARRQGGRRPAAATTLCAGGGFSAAAAACQPQPSRLPPPPPSAPRPPDSGVTSFDKVLPALRAMAELGMPLLVHGEVTDDEVDMFDREAVFIRTKLVGGVAGGGGGQGLARGAMGGGRPGGSGTGAATKQTLVGGTLYSMRY
jgi:hypothetical protein